MYEYEVTYYVDGEYCSTVCVDVDSKSFDKAAFAALETVINFCPYLRHRVEVRWVEFLSGD